MAQSNVPYPCERQQNRHCLNQGHPCGDHSTLPVPAEFLRPTRAGGDWRALYYVTTVCGDGEHPASLSTYINAPQHFTCGILVPYRLPLRFGEEWLGDHLSFLLKRNFPSVDDSILSGENT